MKSVLSIIAVTTTLVMSLAASAPATVIYVSGDQAGTWSADTVIVTAEVRVPPGQSLTILPGVEVLFSVYCKLIVDSAATLRAVGTPTDSIRFDVLLPDSSWHGIRFLCASDSCRLEYCYLTHGNASGEGEDANGGAIYCSSSSPTISGNTISDNFADFYGGGIYCGNNSNPTIVANIINRNRAAGGGGIYCDNSSPSIIGNTVSENDDGGICCVSSSSPTIDGNTISENGGMLGGGIRCNNSSPTISGNTISGNGAGGGGGICCGSNSSPTISSNTIRGNSASFGGGGGIYCYNSSTTISGNTISGNSAWGIGGGIYCGNNSSPTVVNCILWGNSIQQIYQDGTSHLQATYCDIQDTLWAGEGNISLDPLFVDPANDDYHLQSTVGSFHGGSWLPDSLYSPCIDAGDPSSPFALEPMPNGGRINMGFEGNTVEASLSTSASVPQLIAELPTEFQLYNPYPNPFNPVTTLSYSLPVSGMVDLTVFDITGRKVVTLINGFSPAGSHRVLFDGSNLASGVYFYQMSVGDYRLVRKAILLK
jgi:parallel beta-helix repeat protein